MALAGQYDPQPFHLDDEIAKNTMFGGLGRALSELEIIEIQVRVPRGHVRLRHKKAASSRNHRTARAFARLSGFSPRHSKAIKCQRRVAFPCRGGNRGGISARWA
jgi:hypothetical protein